MLDILLLMATVAALLLLLTVPVLVWLPYSSWGPIALAASAMLSMVVLSSVAFVAAIQGYGIKQPLIVFGVVWLVLGVVGAGRRLLILRKSGNQEPERRTFAFHLSRWDSLPVAIACACWLFLRPIKFLAWNDTPSGVVTLGNNDIALYSFAAENLSIAGFSNANLLVSINLGQFPNVVAWQGATMMQSFVAAVTGKSAFEAAMPTMMIAVAMLFLGVAALSNAIWPQSAAARLIAPAIAALMPLTTYVAGNYFLAQFFGIASLTTCLAGVTALVRGQNGTVVPLLAMSAGAAFGLHAYPILLVPALIGFPIWGVVVWAIQSSPRSVTSGGLIARLGVGSVGVLLLGALALPGGWQMFRTVSGMEGGWPMGPVSSLAAFVRPEMLAGPTSFGFFLASWIVGAALVAWGIVAAWRGQNAENARVAAALVLVCAGVLVLAMVYYGPDAYKAWKGLAYLLPIIVAAAVPAIAAIQIRSWKVGRWVSAALLVAALFAPWTTWGNCLKDRGYDPARGPAAYWSTTRDMIDLRDSAIMGQLDSVNLHTPTIFETMTLATLLNVPTLAISSVSYYAKAVIPETCTLTQRSSVPAGVEGVIPVVGEYVLVPYPSECDWSEQK